MFFALTLNSQCAAAMKRTVQCLSRLALGPVRVSTYLALARTHTSPAHSADHSPLQSHTCARRSRWRWCASSASSSSHVMCAVRAVSSPASDAAHSSLASSTLCLEHFVASVQRLLQEEDTTSGMEDDEHKKAFTASQQACIAALWESSYHKRIFVTLRDVGYPTGYTGAAETQEWEEYIPLDAESLPLFLVCVSAAANVLSKAPTLNSDQTVKKEKDLYQQYVAEMRALVLFVIYNDVPSISSLFDWVEHPTSPSQQQPNKEQLVKQDESFVAGNASLVVVVDLMPFSDAVVPAVDTEDKAYREAISELRVERRGREKVRELAPHLSPELLLRTTVLLDMVHSVTTTFALPLKGYAVLYQTLLCGMSTSSQLTNATLLVMLDCMQRCLDGYLADLELSAEDKNEARVAAAEAAAAAAAPATAASAGHDRPGCLESYDDIRVFLPLRFWPKDKRDAQSAASARDDLSLVEIEELAQLQRRRGGVQRPTVMPAVVLDHLHIVARVLCQRMEAQILAYHRVHLGQGGGAAPPPAHESGRWKDDPAREAAALRQLQSERGKLNLMRLEERKKVEPSAAKLSPQRRTLRTFQTAAPKTAADEAEAKVPEGGKDGQPSRKTTAESEAQQLGLQPAELALSATYLAAMRFRDDAFWTAVRRLSCLLLHCHREAADGKAVQTAKEAEVKKEGEEKEEEEEALIMAMKDITFALDYVNRPTDYQRVMDALVKKKYLATPIPPPSQHRRAMSSVQGERQ